MMFQDSSKRVPVSGAEIDNIYVSTYIVLHTISTKKVHGMYAYVKNKAHG